MAADQRKRRPSSTTAPFEFQEQYRAKRRDSRSLQCEFSFNNHVSLKWDDNEKRVVAKEEQIGISSRHLAPFGAVSSSKLADVVAVPKEAFELSNLAEVLSYEVWQSLLTEKERSSLAQFFPQGVEPDEVVEGLLGGENFHFGNPFLKWGSSLCSGDLHPDAVVQHEKSFKASKKAYYSELQQYHDNMLWNLQKLKERCITSKDPEAEILNFMSRSKGHGEKNICSDASGYKSHKLEENAVYESPSSIADEKSYYSDNPKLSAIRDAAEIQKRIRNRELMKDKSEKWMASPNGLKNLPRLKKVEKCQKSNVTFNDGTKYMSYVKISKKQHELVKSMRQSGNSIPSKNLNRLLGNFDSFNVKPYEMFGEEEQKRVHKHWTNMVNKDLPAALQNWRNGQLERLKIMGSLWQEMEDKLGLLTKDDNLIKPFDEGITATQDMGAEGSQGFSEGPEDNGLATQGSMSDSDKESSPCSSKNESAKYSPALNVNVEFEPSIQNQSLQNSPPDVKEVNPSFIEDQCFQNPPLNANEELDLSYSRENRSLQTLDVNEEFDPSSIENRSSMDSPLKDDHEFHPMDLNAENDQVTSETSDTSSLEMHVVQKSEVSLGESHPETHGSATAANVVGMPSSSVKNVWSPIGLPESYGLAHPSTQYVSSSEPIVRHSQVVLEQPTQLIDLESALPEEGTTKDLLNRHTNHIPFFNPYSNRDRNELLQSLIKRDNFHQEPKKTGLEFHPASVMLETSQYPSHFREQLHPSFALDPRQKAQSELYMNQNIQDSIYSESNRYPLQGQEHFSALNTRDWSNPRMSAPMQSQLSSRGLLNHNHNLFMNDIRAHGSWSGSDGTVFPSTSIGTVGSGDQSLYSVLSQCNTMHSRAPYNPVGLNEQIMPSTSYGQDMVAGIPMSGNPMAQTASPFDYLSGGEAAPILKNPNMGWMSLGHQPPAIHDPSGKPFLKSWHQ